MEHGLYMKHCKVEVYLLEFKLFLHPKLNEPVNKSFSRADTIGTLCSLYRADGHSWSFLSCRSLLCQLCALPLSFTFYCNVVG